MGIEFAPQNELEQAIHDCNPEKVIQALADGEHLDRLISASWLGNDCFSDEVIFSVLYKGLTLEQVKTMTSGWFWGHLHAGKRVSEMTKNALKPLPVEPTDCEKKLIIAILSADDAEIIRLIRDEGIKFQGFTPELLKLLPVLSKSAALTFLRDGLTSKLKAVVFHVLLTEVTSPDILSDFPHRERLKYANLMMHIVMGENVNAEAEWFPDGTKHDFSYYYDPTHCFCPYNE